MKKLTALFGAAALALVLVTGCEETVTPVDPIVVPNAPTGLMANSGDSTIFVKWTASTTTTVTKYRISAMASGSTTKISFNDVASTDIANGVELKGLTNGTVYTISVQAVTADTVSSAASIMWSPARRWTTFTNANPIKLYETASSFASGMAFTTAGPESRTLTQGATWDLCVDTRNEVFDIGSPEMSSYTITGPRSTKIGFDSTKYSNASSLNTIFFSDSVKVSAPALVNFNNVTKPFMFVFQTQDGNYGRCLVKATNNTILQGAAGSRYVELEVSYNPTAGKPYAKIGNATKGE